MTDMNAESAVTSSVQNELTPLVLRQETLNGKWNMYEQNGSFCAATSATKFALNLLVVRVYQLFLFTKTARKESLVVVFVFSGNGRRSRANFRHSRALPFHASFQFLV